jgi:hypothetical protein
MIASELVGVSAVVGVALRSFFLPGIADLGQQHGDLDAEQGGL